jgi:hypothetical protein
VIDNAIEDNDLASATPNLFWIGISDRISENIFLRVTGGSTPFFNWNGGQPNGRGAQNCVAMTANDVWHDEECDQAEDYICECDGMEPDPTAF